MKTFFLSLALFVAGSLFAQNKLQTLIDNTPDGGTVVIPAGKHVIDTPLNIEGRSGLTLKGEGNCKIYLTDLWKNVLIVTNSTSIKLEGLYLSHLKPLKEYQCNGGVVLLSNSQKLVVDNCELEGSGTIGIKGYQIKDLKVTHCYIHDNTFNAFYFHDAREVLIHECRIEDNANMIQSYKLDGFEMSDNLIKNNGGYWRDKGNNPGLRK